MGKVWIVADTTYREIARQPLYYILLLFFSGAIFFSRFFTLFAFKEGDEQNMIREMGVASLTVCGILLSVIMASVVITSEVEKLTTLTLLSKPISRGQFLVGKYMGLILSNIFAVTFLFLVLAYTLWVKEVFPHLEKVSDIFDYPGAGRVILPQLYFPFVGEAPLAYGVYTDLVNFCQNTLNPVFKGTLLSFLQIAVLASIAVSVAPHFSLVINGASAFLLFALGHMTQYIHVQAKGASLFYYVLAQIFFLAMPNLGYFNAASLLATRSSISYEYVGAAGAYGVLYITAALAIATVLFSRKEVK